jgi:hypothetical protein
MAAFFYGEQAIKNPGTTWYRDSFISLKYLCFSCGAALDLFADPGGLTCA